MCTEQSAIKSMDDGRDRGELEADQPGYVWGGLCQAVYVKRLR